MNTSSRKPIGSAREIVALIQRQVDELRFARLGSQFQIDGTEFSLLVSKRNTIYRVRDGQVWYAKLPSRDGQLRAEHEKAGAEVMLRVFSAVPACFPLTDVAFDVEQGIIVTGEVPGEHMQTQLYRAMPAMQFQSQHWILRAYHQLGQVLAAFHNESAATSLKATRVTGLQEYEAAVGHLRGNSIEPRMREAIESLADCDNDTAFIHSNLRRENVLLTPDRRIGLIDFEDAGLGSRYDDLSKLVVGLLLTKTATVFPWRSAYRALDALLRGYTTKFEIDPRALLTHASIRVATQYALSFTNKRQSVARIPISQKRTRDLLETLLRAREEGSLSLVDRRLAMS